MRSFAALRMTAYLLLLAALAQPSHAQQPAAGQKTIRAVMHSDLKVLDPIWTTANIVRNHGYMGHAVRHGREDAAPAADGRSLGAQSRPAGRHGQEPDPGVLGDRKK
jgi:hypothetical protein